MGHHYDFVLVPGPRLEQRLPVQKASVLTTTPTVPSQCTSQSESVYASPTHMNAS